MDWGFWGLSSTKRNAETAAVISRNSGRVKVRDVHTDEEVMIARSVRRVLALGPTGSP